MNSATRSQGARTLAREIEVWTWQLVTCVPKRSGLSEHRIASCELPTKPTTSRRLATERAKIDTCLSKGVEDDERELQGCV